MTTYVGLVRDHSGSMRHLAAQAANDFNLTVDGIKSSCAETGQEAFATVVECGVGWDGRVAVREHGVNIRLIKSLTKYTADGGSTPLYDSVGETITQLQMIGPNRANEAYLVMVITDGFENSSKRWTAASLKAEITRLQATDRWTFVFRVPVGHKEKLVRALGIQPGNVMEWEQTDTSLVQSTQATVSATRSYFNARSKGVTQTGTFYADLSTVSTAEVRRELSEVSHRYTPIVVPLVADTMKIKDFVEARGFTYNLGEAFYQLTKYEKKVQPTKEILIKDRSSGHVYSGSQARNLLGIPEFVDCSLSPGKLGNYDVFIQSTSVNRKLVGGTTLYIKKQ